MALEKKPPSIACLDKKKEHCNNDKLEKPLLDISWHLFSTIIDWLVPQIVVSKQCLFMFFYEFEKDYYHMNWNNSEFKALKILTEMKLC